MGIVPYGQHGNPHRFSSTKIPWRGIQAAAAAVTLPFSQLKLGRRVSGGLLSLSKSAVAISAGRRADPPLSLLKRKKEFAFHLYCKIQASPEDYTENLPLM